MSEGNARPGRHSAHDADETALLPRIGHDADATTLLPRIGHDADATTLLPRIGHDADATTLLPRQAVQVVEIDADATTLLPTVPSAPPTAAPSAPPAGEQGAPPTTVPSTPPTTVVPPATPSDEQGPIPAAARGRSAGDIVRVLARSAGELLVTFGLVVLLLAAYEIWGKGALINAHQNDLNNQLAQVWGDPAVGATSAAPPGAPPPGWAIARLYIPKLNMHWVVVEGVALKDIRFTPGHYPGTAMPGQPGNFSVAGHREPGIFWDLDKIGVDDDVVVETNKTWYVYQVYQSEIVSPATVEVVAPVPNQPGVAPQENQKDLTLTTCNPKWDNYQRLVVHAHLLKTYPHSQRPPELGGA